ncbi:LOW QUALITY PROTEIN: hypothetical protein PHMEG_0002127 [Phytophthora megakarya]|uniref:Uncharacterized protein n=1 Tax=Phytophthora megakarya TaxID=4795 RepID=A0A225WZ04_9STRA|nr:LOW QUALITY PROTEIN: hypothetical protein PHMEG_0002127 [Phytophthora megakarya]
MTPEVLSSALPFRSERIILIASLEQQRLYCSDLITAQNVRDLMAALPWYVLARANVPQPISFKITVDSRFGFLIQRYSPSTHRFPVSSAQIRDDPYLALFRKNRWSHAEARWKQILELFMLAMLLVRPESIIESVLHAFPQAEDEVAWYPGIEARKTNLVDPQLHRREQTTLMEVLADCDTADLWCTHYHQNHTDHPARPTTCLAGKFFNMAALNPNAPSLRPQQ